MATATSAPSSFRVAPSAARSSSPRTRLVPRAPTTVSRASSTRAVRTPGPVQRALSGAAVGATVEDDHRVPGGTGRTPQWNASRPQPRAEITPGRSLSANGRF